MKDHLDWQKINQFLIDIDEVMPPGMLRSSHAKLANLRSAHPHELKVDPHSIRLNKFDQFQPVSTWFVKGWHEQKAEPVVSRHDYDYFLKFFFRLEDDRALFRLLVL